MKKKPQLILVNGFPASGKTAIATKISNQFHIPLLSKDWIKEILFDSLGYKDREWSKKLGLVSYSILYRFVESELKFGHDTILESNFKQEDESVFVEFQAKYGVKILQIFCRCEGKVLFDRFENRAHNKNRHSGHQDKENLAEFKEVLVNEKQKPLNINGQLEILDTTKFETINYEYILEKVRLFLDESA